MVNWNTTHPASDGSIVSRAAVRPHDLTRDAQAEALPAAAEPAARARGFHAEEPIEDAPAIRLGNFRAGICNPEDGHAVVRGELTADRSQGFWF